MPSHYHSYYKFNYYSWVYCNNSGNYRVPYRNDSDFQSSHANDNRGGNQAHNNMLPYITAYCWRRYQ